MKLFPLHWNRRFINVHCQFISQTETSLTTGSKGFKGYNQFMLCFLHAEFGQHYREKRRKNDRSSITSKS